MTDPDAGGLPQALASAPRCASCSHLGSGFLCRLRDLDVRPTEATTCASHSETTRKPDPVPVGPALRMEASSARRVAESPTDRATRDHVFELLGRIYDDFSDDGSLRHRMILWQSRRFDERRARYMLESVEQRSLPRKQGSSPLGMLGLSGLIEHGTAPGRDGRKSTRPFTFAGRTLVFTACLVFAGAFWLTMELVTDDALSVPPFLAMVSTAAYVQLGLYLAKKRGIPLREPEAPMEP